MSVEILSVNGGQAVLTCNTSDWAFGPIFSSREHAEDFCDWLRECEDRPTPVLPGLGGGDPRNYTDSDLERLHGRWLVERVDDEGGLREEVTA